MPEAKYYLEQQIPVDSKDKRPRFISQEVDHGYRYKRQLHPNWSEICKLIYGHTGKSNLIDTAYEGGFRLQRRYKNMQMAFTYGYKLTYDDLDDPKLKEKILTHLKMKQERGNFQSLLQPLQEKRNRSYATQNRRKPSMVNKVQPQNAHLSQTYSYKKSGYSPRKSKPSRDDLVREVDHLSKSVVMHRL